MHIVKGGESLSLIAKQYGISLKELVILNNIKNPDLIRIVQEIVIPGKEVELIKESGG